MAIRDRIKAKMDAGRDAGKGSGRGKDAGRNRGGGRLSDRIGDMLPGGFGNALEDLISFASDMSEQARGRAQGEIERLAQKLDLVTRREFEAVRAIAIAAREQAERLEAQLNGKPVKQAAKPTQRTAAKPSAKTAAAKLTAKPAPKAAAGKPAAKIAAKATKRR